MRRSSMLMMAIMLVAFGVMFAAAGSALRPLAEDADSARLLRRMLEARGDLAPGARVRLSRAKAGAERLARAGFGLVISFEPSPAVRARPGALRAVAIRAAHEALSRYRGTTIDWVEIVFELDPAGPPEARLRTLLEVREGGLLGEPDPPPPVRLAAASPSPVARPAR